jgi:hypothetical protein
VNTTNRTTNSTPAHVALLAALYAALLALLDRLVPVRRLLPTWAKVTGGVILTTVPAMRARRRDRLTGEQFEHLLALSFLASGAPIILWQLVEAFLSTRRRPHSLPLLVVRVRLTPADAPAAERRPAPAIAVVPDEQTLRPAA